MNEACKNKYFVDGFMIKHFDIWPLEFDKNNLFEEQKIFLIYLLGAIPEKQEWAINIEYQKRLSDIKKLKLSDIRLSETDISLAKLQNRSIDKLKKERLREEKQRRKLELDEKYGIETKETESEIEGLPEPNVKPDQQTQLWDMLQAKGLINKNG